MMSRSSLKLPSEDILLKITDEKCWKDQQDELEVMELNELKLSENLDKEKVNNLVRIYEDFVKRMAEETQIPIDKLEKHRKQFQLQEKIDALNRQGLVQPLDLSGNKKWTNISSVESVKNSSPKQCFTKFKPIITDRIPSPPDITPLRNRINKDNVSKRVLNYSSTKSPFIKSMQQNAFGSKIPVGNIKKKHEVSPTRTAAWPASMDTNHSDHNIAPRQDSMNIKDSQIYRLDSAELKRLAKSERPLLLSYEKLEEIITQTIRTALDVKNVERALSSQPQISQPLNLRSCSSQTSARIQTTAQNEEEPKEIVPLKTFIFSQENKKIKSEDLVSFHSNMDNEGTKSSQNIEIKSSLKSNSTHKEISKIGDKVLEHNNPSSGQKQQKEKMLDKKVGPSQNDKKSGEEINTQIKKTVSKEKISKKQGSKQTINVDHLVENSKKVGDDSAKKQIGQNAAIQTDKIRKKKKVPTATLR